MSKITVAQKDRGSLFRGSPYARWCFGIALLCIALSLALIFWRLFPELYGKEVVPLHYNIHYGVDWTGVWWQIFVYPAASVLLCIVHGGIALYLVKMQPVLFRVVCVATALFSLFLFASTVFVVLMNMIYG